MLDILRLENSNRNMRQIWCGFLVFKNILFLCVLSRTREATLPFMCLCSHSLILPHHSCWCIYVMTQERRVLGSSAMGLAAIISSEASAARTKLTPTLRSYLAAQREGLPHVSCSSFGFFTLLATLGREWGGYSQIRAHIAHININKEQEDANVLRFALAESN